MRCAFITGWFVLSHFVLPRYGNHRALGIYELVFEKGEALVGSYVYAKSVFKFPFQFCREKTS